MNSLPTISEAREKILRLAILDRRRLLSRIDSAASRGDVVDEGLAREIDRAVGRFDERKRNAPRPKFDQDLPILARRDDIARLIEKHQVIVVCGETGSGKTTQLPQICLAAGRGVRGMIGHTQPRRIAARTVATRIASELGVTLRGAVGYKVRFGDQTGRDTYIKLMTDGLLLAETRHDQLLEHYDTIIVDEAHERSLNIDFLLGRLKQILPRRSDLRLIITSATIDPQRFSKHFSDAPIVEVEGRTYPVETIYPPINDEPVSSGQHGRDAHDTVTSTRVTGVPPVPAAEAFDLSDAVRSAIDELWQTHGPGDTLVFFATEREIRDAADALSERFKGSSVEILPLFARLSGEQQMRVFQPGKMRHRIVLATNVAETSLTVPGIRFVIDPGTARISRYSGRSRVQRLPIEPISQASANQRKGRCGRVSNGVCVRLYSEEDFAQRPAFTEPEIYRTSLANVILQMESLGLGAIAEFPFVDPPDARQVRDGYQTLHELGAIDEENRLTHVGRAMARLPVDPRIARMIVQAIDEDCVPEVAIIASALSVQDPRERPADAQQAADASHARFADGQSDFVSLLNLWHFVRKQETVLSNRKFRNWCRDNFLSFTRLREWEDVHDQVRQAVHELGERERRDVKRGEMQPQSRREHRGRRREEKAV